MAYTMHQQIICDYVNTISKGLITLSPKHCATLLKLAKQPLKTGLVEMYQWQQLKSNYGFKFKASISENTINEVIQKQKQLSRLNISSCSNVTTNPVNY